MRNVLVTATLLLLAGSVFAQPAATWEVRKKPNGQCEVVRVQGGPSAGTRVAGPFKNRKRAEEELSRLRNTPKCRK